MQRIIDEPLPLRILTVAILIAGYVFLFRPAEAHLLDIETTTQNINERAAFGEALLARRDIYERAAERMRTELSGITFDADGTTMMADFLDDLANRTNAHHVTLAEISPDHDAATQAQTSALTLHIHGTYRPVIAFLNDVSSMHTLVRIDGLHISRTAGDLRAGETPDLDASMRASLIPIHTQTAGPLE